MFATALNLLPVGQLDGGHIVYALLGRSHKWITWTFLLALLPMGKLWNGWWFWAVLLFLFARRHPPVYDETDIGLPRIRLGVLALVVFILCFSIAPILADAVSPAALSGPGFQPAAGLPSRFIPRLMQISATIVTLNEERNIARAIGSLGCADEIVVVDSGSTDRTREIAPQLGARVIEEPWRGYAAQKNFAACSATHDWILSLDADEQLTPELAVGNSRAQDQRPAFDGYTFPRLAQYLGRWIHHSGWYPDRKVRLYDRRKAKWVGRYVHESVRVEGSVGELHGDLLHFTCASLSEHLRTLDRYTTLAAAGSRRAARNRCRFSRLALDPAWTFFRTYVIQRGFLDGPQGLAIAWMAALYTFLKYAKASFRNENPPSR